MSTIFFAWELGANLGHVTTIAPVADELMRRGHRVVAALRDVSRAELLGDVEVLAAPFCHTLRRKVVTYADLLANAGFADETTLGSLVKAWQCVFMLTKPDVVVCDHSPTAILAARAVGLRCVTLGTGFGVPPNASPLPNLVDGLASFEEPLVANVNRITPIGQLADLYYGCEAHLLTTVAELDHFGSRQGVEYFGPLTGGFGSRPKWPSGKGPRVFAYLKPFAGLEPLLGILDRKNLPRLVVLPQTELVDLNTAIEEADLVISHASHGVTAAAVLRGRPTLVFPTQAEQYLFGRAVERLGAGRIARPETIEYDLDAAMSLKVPRLVAPPDPVPRLADRIEAPRCRELPREH
jgi:hypothetical protein